MDGRKSYSNAAAASQEKSGRRRLDAFYQRFMISISRFSTSVTSSDNGTPGFSAFPERYSHTRSSRLRWASAAWLRGDMMKAANPLLKSRRACHCSQAVDCSSTLFVLPALSVCRAEPRYQPELDRRGIGNRTKDRLPAPLAAMPIAKVQIGDHEQGGSHEKEGHMRRNPLSKRGGDFSAVLFGFRNNLRLIERQ